MTGALPLEPAHILAAVGLMGLLNRNGASDAQEDAALSIFERLITSARANGFDGHSELLRAVLAGDEERACRLAADACTCIPADDFLAVLTHYHCEGLLTEPIHTKH